MINPWWPRTPKMKCLNTGWRKFQNGREADEDVGESMSQEYGPAEGEIVTFLLHRDDDPSQIVLVEYQHLGSFPRHCFQLMDN